MLLANYRVTLFVATIIASSVVVPGKFWLIRSINSVIGCLCLQFWILLTRTIITRLGRESARDAAGLQKFFSFVRAEGTG